MVKYDPEKHMLLELHHLSKSDIQKVAKKQRRSVNNLVNIAIEEYIIKHESI